MDPAATAGRRLREAHSETEGTGLYEALREALETQETANCELYLEEPGVRAAERAHPSETG